MENIHNALKFYYQVIELKNRIRSGWNEEHWNINAERRESIAEHVFGVCILAISMHSEQKSTVNLDKVLKMLIIHELGEIKIGDITPFNGVSKEEKHAIELQAVNEICSCLMNKQELVDLFIEFDEGKTKEAKFAYHCDKLEADLQSKYYQDNGNHRSLDNQEGNIVMNFPKTKEILETAKVPFDVWYEYDKTLYDDDKNFRLTLDYVKEHNVNEIKK